MRDLGAGATAVPVARAAAAELVLLAVPWLAVPDALTGLPAWGGRILVDATNPFVAFDPLQLADLGGSSASEIVAGYAPGARVVRAFNSITMADFDKGPVEETTRGVARRVLFVSGDDPAATAAGSGLPAEGSTSPHPQLFAVGGISDAIMETPGLNLNVYEYYGVQRCTLFKLPYWFAFINGASFFVVGWLLWFFARGCTAPGSCGC